jgi:beta-lactamase class A
LHLAAVLVVLAAAAARTAAQPAPLAEAPTTGQVAPVGVGLPVPTQVAPLGRGLSAPEAPGAALAGPPDPRLPTLAAQIEAILQERSSGSAYGVAIEWVPGHERASHDAQREFEAASVYKIAVAYAVLEQVDRGQIGLADPLTITDDDAVEVEPEGGLAPNDQVSVWDALQAMMGVSSNSAAHALMRLIGRAEINAALARLGLPSTRVPADDDPDGAAVTTASDMAHLLDLLAEERLLTPDSRQSLRALLGVPKDLDPLLRCLPEGTQVLSKPGNQERASNIAGLVSTPNGPLIISVFDTDVDPGDARATIEAITQAAWDVYAN